MITLTLLLVLLALLFTVLNAVGKLPPWPAILMLVVVELLRAGGLK